MRPVSGGALVVFLLWLAALVAPAGQTSSPNNVTIAGSVVDVSLSPIANVVVTLNRASKVAAKTTTGADGRYKLTDIAPGDYQIRAEHEGFQALTRDLRVAASPATLQLPLVLTRPSDATAKSAAVGAATPPASPTAARGGGGTTSSAVNVESAAPLIQAQSGERAFSIPSDSAANLPMQNRSFAALSGLNSGYFPPDTESYPYLHGNTFHLASADPLSTFGADVDTASFTNVRRFLTNGQLPPTTAVRPEDFVNYFHFPYQAPRDGRPVALTTETGPCPWAPTHSLVLIGARAAALPKQDIEGRNIVLLVDVSGSMATPDKLPLLKTAFSQFVNSLSPDDRVAIVTYAGTSGIALPPTPARDRERIQQVIGNLYASGGTNGGEGLIAAYRLARQSFIPGGVNRVILATDGDFNVGITSQQDLVTLISREKDSGVFLSVFGVGTGNLKDSTMELLADRGNGHYAYLDSLEEAHRVLIREADATLDTVAKDVKFQVEFNPARVHAWKLIGYEDRGLSAQDFANDRADGGEMGAGHTVTVLYEVIPEGSASKDDALPSTSEPLRYRDTTPATPVRSRGDEYATVKVRYKLPADDTSREMAQVIQDRKGDNLPVASLAAEFALLLRDASADASAWATLERRLSLVTAGAALREDVGILRQMVDQASRLSSQELRDPGFEERLK